MKTTYAVIEVVVLASVLMASGVAADSVATGECAKIFEADIRDGVIHGPTAGLGAFYHLTNEWSLRGDAQATLGLDGDDQMVYSLGLGVQYSF